MKKLLVAVLVAISALTIGRADTIVIKGSDTLGAKLIPQFGGAI
jgi:hypothetical protein